MKLEWMMHFIAKHDACELRRLADALHARMPQYNDWDIAEELAWAIIDGIPACLLPSLDADDALADVFDAAFNIAANQFQLTI